MSDTKGATPDKLYYKAAEVCQITDTQPYVLRFWESEFPQLASEKNRSGQRVYRREDIDLILRIKKLLYEEEFTIAGARKVLDGEKGTVVGEAPSRGKGAKRPPAGHHADEPPAVEVKKAAASRTALFDEPEPPPAAAPSASPQVPAAEVEDLKRELEDAVAKRDALRERHRRIADRLQAALEA